MAEIIHTFQRGRMNKDLDERLVPNGEYRDALNLDVSVSESSDIGSFENTIGNLTKINKSYNPDTLQHVTWETGYINDLTNPVCVGSGRDTKNNKIYWLIHSEEADCLAEYDQSADVVVPVLVDTNNILKLSYDYLVTGINILDGLFFYTDDKEEPKKINIERFKEGSTDFVTHTQVFGDDFLEEHITVIKKSPLQSPTLNLSASENGVDSPGTGLTPAVGTYMVSGLENFTYMSDPVDDPAVYSSLPTYTDYTNNIADNPDFYDGTAIDGWNGLITMTFAPAPTVWNAGDTIFLSGTLEDDNGDEQTFGLSLLLTAVVFVTGGGLQITGKIQAISSDIIRNFSSSTSIEAIQWEGILQEKEPMFRHLFPRFATRWKYKDGEYSCFSPFTGIAFIGGEFEYVSSDGYNIGMQNNVRKIILEGLDWGTDEVVELDILYKESHNTTVYKVDTLKRDQDNATTSYEIVSELIGAVINSNQLLRPWDNVPRAAKAQEVTGNRLVYGNYLQNFDIDSKIKISLSEAPEMHPGNIIIPGVDNENKRMPYSSVKSIRTYQGGVVFKDKYGRETPVFTDEKASVRVDKSSAVYKNALVLNTFGDNTSLSSKFTHFKAFIKETSNEYYNLALDRFYFAEDGNVWLSFPSSERNKVDEETYLILKKQHDNDIPTTGEDRYKILAIENEAPEFISTFKRTVAQSEVQLDGIYGDGFLAVSFTGPATADNPDFASGFNSVNYVKITSGSASTDFYRISVGGRTGNSNDYSVTFDKELGQDAAFLSSLSSGATVKLTIYTDTTERLPEFEGRFFAKINRDFAFDTNIVETFGSLEKQYGVIGQAVMQYSTAPESGWEYMYRDPGQNECGSKYKTMGTGWAGNGSDIINDTIKERMAPPTQGSNWFGFSYAGKSIGDYVDAVVGTVGNNPTGLIKIGSLIRFKSVATGEEGIEYKVLEVHQRNNFRGNKINTALTCSKQVDKNSNKRFDIVLKLDKPLEDGFLPAFANDTTTLELHKPTIQVVEKSITDGNKKLTSSNPAIFETEPKEAVDIDIYYEASGAIPISEYGEDINGNPSQFILDWSNCYSYGNGVESNRIRDDFNAFTIDKGPKVSATLDEPYGAERRSSGLIYSGLYNSMNGINNINQFIQAEKITKDLNPEYGSIQKLHSRDTDLVTLCEDKCLRVLANKDALYNADGNLNLTATNNVLGQAIPYAGEFGISTNPESFSSYGYRAYFSDKSRGAVIRLSADGITEIQAKGMADFFSDNLPVNKYIFGSYDDDKNQYNITLNSLTKEWQSELSEDLNVVLNSDCGYSTKEPVLNATISFSEGSDGWTTRRSFIPEFGQSLNMFYYTFKNGKIWEHSEDATRNNFYGVQYGSLFTYIMNQNPVSVKGFKTLNYTGTSSKKYDYTYDGAEYTIAEIVANQYLPTASSVIKDGWWCNYIVTDLEAGMVKEFVNKENKWFNYIKPVKTKDDCDPKNISAIGTPSNVSNTTLDYYLNVKLDEVCSSYNPKDGYTVAVTSVVVPEQSNVYSLYQTINLVITPSAGYALDATRFLYSNGTGYTNVTFTQDGDNVIATVTIDATLTMPSNNLDLEVCIIAADGVSLIPRSVDFNTVMQNTNGTTISFLPNYSVTLALPAANSYRAEGYFNSNLLVGQFEVEGDAGYALVSDIFSTTDAYQNGFMYTLDSETFDVDGNLIGQVFNVYFKFLNNTTTVHNLNVNAAQRFVHKTVSEITAYSQPPAVIHKYGGTIQLTIFGGPGAEFSLSMDNGTTVTDIAINEIIPIGGSITYPVFIPAISGSTNVTNEFTLTGDLASSFDTTGQDSVFSILQAGDKELTINFASSFGAVPSPLVTTVTPLKSPLRDSNKFVDIAFVFNSTAVSPLINFRNPTLDDFEDTYSLLRYSASDQDSTTIQLVDTNKGIQPGMYVKTGYVSSVVAKVVSLVGLDSVALDTQIKVLTNEALQFDKMANADISLINPTVELLIGGTSANVSMTVEILKGNYEDVDLTLNVDRFLIDAPTSLKPFLMDEEFSSATLTDACLYSANYSLFYHDGTTDYPEIGDTVYSNWAGTVKYLPTTTKWHKTRDGGSVEINTLGVTTDRSLDCPITI